MLHINELSFRIEGRPLFENATAAIPEGHKVGLVGRNGTGKTTLLRLIAGEIAPDGGSIGLPRNARLAHVSQEAPGGPETLLDTVLAAHTELAALTAEAETAHDPHRISEIHTRLADLDAHSAPSRAARILSGLGFDEAAQQRSCSEFSGGWRMRVALAGALFAAPDILLLDEPTNYLDLEGVLWLEDFIASYPYTVLIVSHDRDLLNNAVNSILHLNDKRLSLYTGGYDRFEETRREQQRLQLKLKKSQDDQRRHMEAFVERFRAKATKAKQAQSRLKALARLQPIAAEVDAQVVPFRFPSPERPLGNPLIRIEGASVGYDPARPILRGINLRLDADDRVGLLGSNGNGKSTLAKLLCGKLAPIDGQRRASNKLEYGYFAQHQLDELRPKLSAYDHIAELMPDATEAQKRARVASIGFGADKADTASEKLSGGEKARLLFALATFHAPHLLILDEPTNHLDVDSREELIHALNDYEGAVILISHDRHLLEATVDRLWVVRNGTVAPYDGDLESYRAESLAAAKQAAKASGGERPAEAKKSREEERRQTAQRRAELAPLKKQMTDLEKRVHDLQKKMTAIDERLADHTFYEREPDKARALTLDRAALLKDLKTAEDAWFEASLAYEEAAADA
ncbi:ABC-F family ATP-binding cassette domain-containing protein [Rhodomicrobium lacus]|uniref:ABC-F family ATP-binding cassette domain-containing protein n=1 Tax=Rhodomicrobium lacus TaxID=2498452 RepID=UPI0026E1A193|nr:ABC-F family ATP-binding cassette domain-containing protein [Rhodomicrobium lacus]WKW52339.1 ABC-F family ATP-binding cassette domain-containing protein [Rhodomicrobium lacus]